MSIYKSAIEKPVTTALIFVAVIVIGLFSLSRLPIDQFPEMDPPYITVMTLTRGRAPVKSRPTSPRSSRTASPRSTV